MCDVRFYFHVFLKGLVVPKCCTDSNAAFSTPFSWAQVLGLLRGRGLQRTPGAEQRWSLTIWAYGSKMKDVVLTSERPLWLKGTRESSLSDFCCRLLSSLITSISQPIPGQSHACQQDPSKRHAQGWPGTGWHQHQAEAQAGAAFVPRVGALPGGSWGRGLLPFLVGTD